jgi:hypothetical protein
LDEWSGVKLFGREIQGNAKVLVILAVALLVSSGLCGVQAMVVTYPSSGRFLGVAIQLGEFELLVMVFSAVGIVLVSIV